MKRAALLAGLALALTSSPPRADDAARGALRHGYAFDDPAVLRAQRLFGLAHGIFLLTSACLDRAENDRAVEQAYSEWYAQQRATLDALRLQLAQYHFAHAAERATWQDIARTLGLKETIYPALGQTTLTEACASLPAALGQPRYDFARLLEAVSDEQQVAER